MRKKLAYSLMAAAAMPGMANAAPVDVNLPSAQQLSSDNWLGNPTVSEGTILVSTSFPLPIWCLPTVLWK